jgi:hypothetical protein
MADNRQIINHKLGKRVPLTRELHYEESNISDAGTLQFLLSLTVTQTRRNSRRDVRLNVGAGEVYCNRLIKISIFYPSLRLPMDFLPFRIPIYNQNFV